jgi:hypothetical protein
MRCLGSAYTKGRGVPISPLLATYWLGRAASLHDGRASYLLAILYSGGIGSLRSNHDLAAQFLQQSVKDGYELAKAGLPCSTCSCMTPLMMNHMIVEHYFPMTRRPPLLAHQTHPIQLPKNTSSSSASSLLIWNDTFTHLIVSSSSTSSVGDDVVTSSTSSTSIKPSTSSPLVDSRSQSSLSLLLPFPKLTSKLNNNNGFLQSSPSEEWQQQQWQLVSTSVPTSDSHLRNLLPGSLVVRNTVTGHRYVNDQRTDQPFLYHPLARSLPHAIVCLYYSLH